VLRGRHKNSIFWFLVSTGLHPEVVLQSGILFIEKQIFPLVHGSSVTNCIFLIHSPDWFSRDSDELLLDDDELLLLDFPDLFNLLRLRLSCLSCRSRLLICRLSEDSEVDELELELGLSWDRLRLSPEMLG